MRMFFLPYAYHVVVFCLFLVFFVFFCVYFCFLFVCFLICACLFPFPATMSFAGYFPARFLLSAFPSFFFLICSWVGLVWFDSAYLVTMAGFIGDQSM